MQISKRNHMYQYHSREWQIPIPLQDHRNSSTRNQRQLQRAGISQRWIWIPCLQEEAKGLFERALAQWPARSSRSTLSRQHAVYDYEMVIEKNYLRSAGNDWNGTTLSLLTRNSISNRLIVPSNPNQLTTITPSLLSNLLNFCTCPLTPIERVSRVNALWKICNTIWFSNRTWTGRIVTFVWYDQAAATY